MSRKSNIGKQGRADPKSNKSLAIRNVLKQRPGAPAADVAAAVKRDYGHEVSKNMIYMMKTKVNMRADGRPKKVKGAKSDNPMNTPTLWIEAIKIARKLLQATGSAANAVALVKAIED